MLKFIIRSHAARAPRLALLFAAAFACAALAAPGQARAQAREMLNRLAQSSNDSAMTAFTLGRAQIDEQKFEQAVATFNNFVNSYPTHREVDAALYWLAYSLEKQNRDPEANETLARLLERFPKSRWAGDAGKLKVKVKAKLDPDAVNVPENADDELIITALQALCQNDRPRCPSLVAETLRSPKSLRVKEAAIILLARYGGPEAVPTLIQLARTETDAKLRMRAISSLGRTGDERALELLREIALSPSFAEESPTDSAIHALRDHESPRAIAILGEVIANSKSLPARQHAARLLSQRQGEAVVDELFRLYESVNDREIREYIVAGLGHNRSPRAAARLAEIARSAGDPELRKTAIRSLPRRGDESNLDMLISLYDSERDGEIKDYILDAIGHYRSPRANQKLMQVVRNPAETLERRKRAMSVLSRSKDPEVLKFLEALLTGRS